MFKLNTVIDFTQNLVTIRQANFLFFFFLNKKYAFNY